MSDHNSGSPFIEELGGAMGICLANIPVSFEVWPSAYINVVL